MFGGKAKRELATTLAENATLQARAAAQQAELESTRASLAQAGG